jgi:hypothetical protein
MDDDRDRALREHLDRLLTSRNAHADFEAAIADLPPTLRGAPAEPLPYTAWQLLEHLRISQHDILEFSRDPDWESPPWPKGYWPETETPPRPAAWEASVAAFRADLAAMRALVTDPRSDLFAEIPGGDGGATLLREALLLADHNAYHVGQLVALRRLLGAWPD